MTTETIQKKSINAKTGKPKVSSRGGARKGAGRPKGSVDKVTIAGLLNSIELQSGRTYQDMLAEDFIAARTGDRNLAVKYHNLILNKVMATMNSVEITDSQDAITAKQAAFAEAIAQITGISTNK
jgi:hypothetical protein